MISCSYSYNELSLGQEIMNSSLGTTNNPSTGTSDQSQQPTGNSRSSTTPGAHWSSASSSQPWEHQFLSGGSQNLNFTPQRFHMQYRPQAFHRIPRVINIQPPPPRNGQLPHQPSVGTTPSQSSAMSVYLHPQGQNPAPYPQDRTKTIETNLGATNARIANIK